MLSPLRRLFPAAFRPWAWLVCLLTALVPVVNYAGVTDLATAPLETSTATLVKPNIFFILDDSGSMDSDYLPDWANSNSASLRDNSGYNGLAYDPAQTYDPPLNYDGSSFINMTSANTSGWTVVPVDAYGRQDTTNIDLTAVTKTYYVWVAGEYCSAPNLRTCVAQTAPSVSYPYPALLRWCTNSTRNVCQANRVTPAPAGGSAFATSRFPGLVSGSLRVPGSSISVTIDPATTTYVYPGTTTRASTRTDCTTNSTTCTYAEEMTNYANWYAYYRTRMQMMKTATSQALIDLGTGFRLGYMAINSGSESKFLDIADISTAAGGQKSLFYSTLFNAIPTGSTPLRGALSKAGRYFAGKLTKINNINASDPMQYACQRNYTILSTDGYWNETTLPTQIDGTTTIGDQDSSESRPNLDGNTQSNTLADVAQYYYNTDIRSSTFSNATNRSTGVDVSSNSFTTGQQRMYTFTLGLGASGYMLYDPNYATATSGDYYDVLQGTATSSTTQAAGTCVWQASGACNWPIPANNTQTAIDDLWHAAINGRGTYYSAGNPADLKSGLQNFVTSVSAANSNSAAATASSPNLSATNSNYIFATSFCSAKWFGELARYSIDAATGDISSTPSWAQSGAGDDCTSSNATFATTPLLDNKSWSTRSIYTYDPTNTTSTLQPFAWSSLTSAQTDFFKVAALSGLSQMCSSGSNCLPAASKVDSTTAGTTTGVGGINLVNYLRGDRSNEGTSNTAYYQARTHVLGDVVNTQAVFIEKPSYNYADSGYSTYKSNNASRTGMVYVGANDGMVHAFNASTGAEVWAYIPSLLLPKLYKLADKRYASNHVNLVDGPLSKGDVYFGGAWHTILVGGLGQGGRGYFALDVTTPSSPTVLWEFTHDTSASASYIKDADLGYTYGQPIMTKLSDGTWAVMVTSGYNNVSPGSGHGILWVLNAATGAIIKKIDTGMGSSTAAVTGCSAAPCPSGLARISAWTDSSTNNTALQVYGGDLYGNLWRFNISALTASGGTATVQLLTTLTDASGNRQPITTTPELGYIGGKHMVYVGTGAYLGVGDVSSSQLQSIYAIKDPLTGTSATSAIYASPRTILCSTSTNTACFVKNTLTDTSGVRTVANNSGVNLNLGTMNGWFADLPETAERINTDPAVVSGTLVFVSNIPTTTSACATGGSSYLNYLSFSTGLTVTGASDVGVLMSSTALASAPTLVMTTNAVTIGLVTLSDGTRRSFTIPTTTSSLATRRVSWRELIVGQ